MPCGNVFLQTAHRRLVAAQRKLSPLPRLQPVGVAPRLTVVLQEGHVGAQERTNAGVAKRLQRLARLLALPRVVERSEQRLGVEMMREPLLRRLPQLGGSNAQRDLFVLALADLAGRDGDAGAFARIRAARAQLKAEDTLIAAVGRQAAQAG